MAVKDYNLDPDLNTTISGINIAEGCPPSGINNAIRQLMADVKAEQEARTTEDTAQDTAITNAATAAANAQTSANAAQQSADAAQSTADEAKAAAEKALAKDSVLPGTVIAYAANSELSGYLLCNGAAVSRTTYAKLYEAIGTTYGAGDGSTTFNLPNLTERFIQGSGTAGKVKAAGLPDAAGGFDGRSLGYGTATPTFTSPSGMFARADGGGVNKATARFDMYDVTQYTQDRYTITLSKGNSIYGASTTVQPPAVTMRYYIKY